MSVVNILTEILHAHKRTTYHMDYWSESYFQIIVMLHIELERVKHAITF